MSEIIRRTRSVCPVCGGMVAAELVLDGGEVRLHKDCPRHGEFSVPVWRGLWEWTDWQGQAAALPADQVDCGACVGLCGHHQQGSCCVLLEVTRRCNLRCRFCFADTPQPEPSLEQLQAAISYIYSKGRRPTLQLSGGEPTLREDLPQLIAYAKAQGAPYVQLNSNGLRLAEDGAYAAALAKAGLSFVFLQFDGVDDEVYQALRGRPLLDVKLAAIRCCDQARLGVALVPTIVPGVNDSQIGDLVRLGAALSPAVRGVHFQPVSYFGRYPEAPADAARYTLDQLLSALVEQAGLPAEALLPSHCDHPRCGCHGSFMVLADGSLYALSHRSAPPPAAACCCASPAERNRDYIGSRWQRGPAAAERAAADITSLDGFLQRSRSHAFTVSAMAFQDAWNLDFERLRRCSLHVYQDGVLKPFCAAYLTKEGADYDG